MFQSVSTSSSKMKIRAPATPIKLKPQVRSVCIKESGTQTLPDFSCQSHSQQITELLTEVAITLGHKAKLENDIISMKEEFNKVNIKSEDMRVEFEKELEKFKNESFKKDMELSKLKVVHLEEQKALISQVTELKNKILMLSQEKETAIQDFVNMRQEFEMKININQENLMKEAEKNVGLQQKVTKYKNKLKYMINYIQQLLAEFKEKQSKKLEAENQNKQEKVLNTSNMEDLILNELFFKPNPVPQEVAELFFKNK